MMTPQPCVFIVENDDALRDSLCMVIELAGIKYRLFDSLDCFLNNYDSTPGCLILDLDLNKIEATQLRCELAKHNIRLPIIFLIAYGFPYDFVSTSLSAVSVFSKPLHIEHLIDKIKSIISQHYQ